MSSTPMTTPTLCLMLLLMAVPRWLSRSGLGGALNGERGRLSPSKCPSYKYEPSHQPTDAFYAIYRSKSVVRAARSRGREIIASVVSPAVGMAQLSLSSITITDSQWLVQAPGMAGPTQVRLPQGSSLGLAHTPTWRGRGPCLPSPQAPHPRPAPPQTDRATTARQQRATSNDGFSSNQARRQRGRG